MRKWRNNTNALQISWTSWDATDGVKLDPSRLLGSWLDSLQVQQVTPLVSHEPDRIATSRFAREDFPYCQAWSVLEGNNLINATFICDVDPTPEEVAEVQQMVDSLGVQEAPKKRWLWF